jgi:hypothetical protein
VALLCALAATRAQGAPPAPPRPVPAPAPGPAEPAAPPPAEAERERVALEAFRAGVTAARAAEWPRAYELFKRASELEPRPVVLFNLAGAEVQTGRLLAAEATYRRFLEAPHDPASTAATERRRAAEAVLKDLEERIPRVRFEPRGLEPGDRLELDGRPLDWPAESEVRVDIGAHELRVLRRGHAFDSEAFEVAEFELRTVSWVVPPSVKPPAPRAGTPVTALETGAAATRPEGSRPVLRSPWLWVALGAIAAGGAAAIALTQRPREPFVGNAGSGVVVVR